MNRFVHRILKSSTASSVIAGGGVGQSTPTAVQQLVKEIRHAKLIYFGEYHSETRIISFQTELIKGLAKCLHKAADRPPRLHLVMEHFSIDMQHSLDTYQQSLQTDNDAFEELVGAYKNGTEGHDLQPYRSLLQFCRQTTKGKSDDKEAFCEVLIHGGFIPRNYAARLNKECPDLASRRVFFEEMCSKGYLPKDGEAMHSALFEDEVAYKLRGSPQHRLLMLSLMRGVDLYSRSEKEHPAGGGDEDVEGEESSMSRLYQAQLLKDHAMGFHVAKNMLDNLVSAHSHSSDRYVVIAGLGHMKHGLGVPACVNGYLRQEALLHPDYKRRTAALDLLLNISQPPLSLGIDQHKFGANGSASIACQMMYEAYLDEIYPPMIESNNNDDDDDEAELTKQRLLKDLYLRQPNLLDEYLVKSEVIQGPMYSYANGIAGFEKPCADYLFVYDEDDENFITPTDRDRSNNESRCPFSQEASSNDKDAKKETIEAYEAVGLTAMLKGNVARARAIMTQIGYTEGDLAYISDDIYNFQGVANPHLVAKITGGETVLDIGSGLGIDSFLAMRDSGAADLLPGCVTLQGKVMVGVDLSESEVNHATKRAIERGYCPQCFQFIRGDVEYLEEALSTHNLKMGVFDVCISNGAFCLVPDKKKAFQNVFRALRPGGRMAISTTTIVSDSLDPSFQWPVCMRMFASLESIKPMCEEIGFTDLRIVDAESPLEDMDVPIEEENTNDVRGKQRFKIHGRYADQFQFLEDLDMDELCKVVTVYGKKPH